MLSRKFETIFVHIPKTGGQSVEHVFLEAHGLDWEGRAPLFLRHNPDPALGPERLAHMFAREYYQCGYVSRDEFDRFRKFTVVRNPYDRLISAYRYRYPAERPPIAEFIAKLSDDPYRGEGRQAALQTAFIHDGEERVLVDTVIKYEDLGQEGPALLSNILGRPVQLPHVNRSAGEDVTFGDDLKRLVYKRYEEDFDTFGYPSGLGPSVRSRSSRP